MLDKIRAAVGPGIARLRDHRPHRRARASRASPPRSNGPGRYRDAGADVIFVEAPTSERRDRARRASVAGHVPLLFNWRRRRQDAADPVRPSRALGFPPRHLPDQRPADRDGRPSGERSRGCAQRGTPDGDGAPARFGGLHRPWSGCRTSPRRSARRRARSRRRCRPSCSWRRRTRRWRRRRGPRRAAAELGGDRVGGADAVGSPPRPRRRAGPPRRRPCRSRSSLASTLPSTATPSVPPTSRTTSFIAEPMPALARGSEPMIASVAGRHREAHADAHDGQRSGDVVRRSCRSRAP